MESWRQELVRDLYLVGKENDPNIASYQSNMDACETAEKLLDEMKNKMVRQMIFDRYYHHMLLSEIRNDIDILYRKRFEIIVINRMITTGIAELSYHYSAAFAKLTCSPEMQITRCDISTRAKHCLRSAHINTVDELIQMHPEQLKNLPSCGVKTRTEILNFITQTGVQYNYAG